MKPFWKLLFPPKEEVQKEIDTLHGLAERRRLIEEKLLEMKQEIKAALDNEEEWLKRG